MTDEHAPSNSKNREIIVIRIWFCFTLVEMVIFKGGNYRLIDGMMLNRSINCLYSDGFL